ncbi:MAG: hypothetical protein IH811_04560 [Proteobacteria bacterium]|nr:hypothetical protein [Pseudomonadota bacterium]
MKDPNSPFRYLAKTYSDELISREHYVSVRAQLLKRLQSKGVVGDDDLQNFIRLAKGEDQPKIQKTYTSSDWIIIALGIVASIVLGYVLYG